MAHSTGLADICDVHVIIPITDPSRIIVNDSYGMMILNAPYASATAENGMMQPSMKDASSNNPGSSYSLDAVLEPMTNVKRFRVRERSVYILRKDCFHSMSFNLISQSLLSITVWIGAFN